MTFAIEIILDCKRMGFGNISKSLDSGPNKYILIIMKITLDRAFDLLNGCAAVIIDQDFLVYPSMADLTGEDDNQFMNLSPSGFNLSYYFEEEGNREVVIDNSTMILYDNDGDKFELKLLFPTQLSSFCQEEDTI